MEYTTNEPSERKGAVLCEVVADAYESLRPTAHGSNGTSCEKPVNFDITLDMLIP